eukprot:gene15303-20619_t
MNTTKCVKNDYCFAEDCEFYHDHEFCSNRKKCVIYDCPFRHVKNRTRKCTKVGCNGSNCSFLHKLSSAESPATTQQHIVVPLIKISDKPQNRPAPQTCKVGTYTML